MSRRRLKITIAALLILGVGILLVSVQILRWNRQAAEVFKRHEEKLRQKAPFNRIIAHRPVLFEPALPGDAWDSYAPILHPLANLQGNWTYSRMPTEEHERFLVLSVPILDGLRMAFSQPNLTLPPNKEDWVQSRNSFSRSLMASSSYLIRIAGGYHLRNRDAEALDALILNLATASDLRRIPSYGVWPSAWAIGEETRAFQHMQQFLEEHSLTSSEIAARLPMFDRLLVSRSSIHDAVQSHGAVHQEYILDWEREDRSDVYGTGPSWKYAFSSRLERSAALNQIELVWKQLEELRSIPSHRWTDILRTISDRKGPEFVPLDHVCSAYKQELQCLRMWTSVPMAMAVARFEIDKGRMPAALTDLVPDYMKTIPRCPEGDEDFKYRPGEFWCHHSGSRWKIARRTTSEKKE